MNPKKSHDPVEAPAHYTWAGVQPIDLSEHLSFCLGNVIKYCFRSSRAAQSEIEDLKKAQWYLEREISRLENKRPVTIGKRANFES